MLRDQYEELRREADRARLDAAAALDAAQRRSAELAARLAELRSGDRQPRAEDAGEGHARAALDALQVARDRDRRGHERAARLHDRAARSHDAAAELYDGESDKARVLRERAAAVRERQAAEQDRRATKLTS